MPPFGPVTWTTLRVTKLGDAAAAAAAMAALRACDPNVEVRATWQLGLVEIGSRRPPADFCEALRQVGIDAAPATQAAAPAGGGLSSLWRRLRG